MTLHMEPLSPLTIIINKARHLVMNEKDKARTDLNNAVRRGDLIRGD